MSENIKHTRLEDAEAEIQRLRAKLKTLEAVERHDEMRTDPIAIVGMGCRFPGGVDSPEAFWELLISGKDILGGIPESRWDVDAFYDAEVSVPGKMYVREGYYLDEVDKFDPQFFGLAPREAESLDPQQRLLLEVSWEALEHASIAPSSLAGGKTGVFVGQYWDDYSMQRIYANDLRRIDRYAQLSGLRGLSAGRIAHVLDSHGPAIQLDTACSSSSLAVHLACQSLHSGESDLALAGGVSLILAPEHLIGICQMKALSPDGRCKTFDASADGFGQGEGCGMVVLKRLRDAEADGDRILAVVQGTAVNHDGHARTVTTPSGPAQRAMLQDALQNAGLDPEQLTYLETHGTGTPLGDPIEVMAIARVLCQERDDPLYLGSVKTNVGHLDAAAGVVGLMKVVLALQHKSIPAHLNYSEPNPRIPWKDWPLLVPTEPVSWAQAQRFAGISAFGMSGTNVHLIVGEAPENGFAEEVRAEEGHDDRTKASLSVLPLSTQNPAALAELAKRYAEALPEIGGREGGLTAACYTAAVGRSHFQHRLAVVGGSCEDMVEGLTRFADGQTSPHVFEGSAGRRAPKVCLLFTGQGAQRVGMGRELYAKSAVFRHWLDACAALLEDELDKPLLEVMWNDEILHQTAYTQPALFAVEYSLAKVWESWGLKPALLIGHSIGEIAAACFADVFSLADGLKLVAARGRLMQSLPTGGEMLSVATDEETVAQHIAGMESDVSIAAINAPTSIVISGASQAIGKAAESLCGAGIKTTRLQVSHAFHSPLMEPILGAFRDVASKVSHRAPAIPIVSNVTGLSLADDAINADYWVSHLRGAVRFADGIQAAIKLKVDTFIEVGPRPTLTALGKRCVKSGVGTWIPSMTPKTESSDMLRAAAQLYTQGGELDWAAFFGQRPQRVVLPNYPWRRQRYWTEPADNALAGPIVHPLLHRHLPLAGESRVFESLLSISDPAYLSDHRVFDFAVFPASAMAELVFQAVKTTTRRTDIRLTNMAIEKPLVLSEEAHRVQVHLRSEAAGFQFEVLSLAPNVSDFAQSDWRRHVSGFATTHGLSAGEGTDTEAIVANAHTRIELEAFETKFSDKDINYLASFRAHKELLALSSGDEVWARLELPDTAVDAGDAGRYAIHPVLLDAGLRLSEAVFLTSNDDEIYLPYAFGDLTYFSSAGNELWVKATGVESNKTRVVDLELYNAGGELVATVERFTLRPVKQSSLRQALTPAVTSNDALAQWIYDQKLEEVAVAVDDEATARRGKWLVFADQSGVAESFVDALEERGCSCVLVEAGSAFETYTENRLCIDPLEFKHFEQVVAETGGGEWSGVAYLWALDASDVTYTNVFAGALHLTQAMVKLGVSSPHWFITQRAWSLKDDAASADGIWQAPLLGFARTLNVEHSQLSSTCIDYGDILSSMDSLVHELIHGDTDLEIIRRGPKRYVATLGRLQVESTGESGLPIQPSGSYVITGGLGALGLELASFLVACGAKRLILSGRSGIRSSEQAARIDDFRARGVTVEVVAVDISQAAGVAKVLESAGDNLRGIIHAAGVIDDAMIVHQNPSRFSKVAAPKVNGAWQLHCQSQRLDLDFFVLFSSVASIMGSPGQSNYSAANAFMDALAHYRHHIGLPALSINWGPWADVGMASTPAVLRRLLNDGWQSMSSRQGCEILSALTANSDVPQAGVIPVDWKTFSEAVPGATHWPVLQRILDDVDNVSEAPVSAAQRIAAEVLRSEAEDRQSRATAYVLERVAQTLRVSVADLDVDESLTNVGIDSLTAVELLSWIRKDLSVELSVEQLFTVPSLAELATSVCEGLNGVTSTTAGGRSGTDQQGSGDARSKWIHCPIPRPEAAKRLICFPFAGGGASAFRDWASRVPADTELLAVQLPGREERISEPLMTRCDEIVQALSSELLPYLDKPFALFGHSMGAVVAYELARRFSADGQRQPTHLFLSSRGAPQSQALDGELRQLEGSDFLDKLHELYGAVPEAIRCSAELRDVFTPILKADVTVLETHSYAEEAPLGCPITVMGGEDDPRITADMLSAWEIHTDGSFAERMYPGGHFYLFDQVEAVVEAIVNQMNTTA